MEPASTPSDVDPAVFMTRPASADAASVSRADRRVVFHSWTERLTAWRSWLVRSAAAGVTVIGAVVLTGWLLNAPPLESILPGWATMKVNTALAFIVSGGALVLLESSRANLALFRLGRALAVLLLALGLLSLVENLFAVDLGIDHLIVPPPAIAGGSRPSGLMSPASAFSFVFFGGALLNLRSNNVIRARVAQWLTVPPLLVATVGLFGYISGVASLYQVRPYASLAAHTVIAILVLAAGILGADPRFGVAAIVLSDSAGGFVARRLLSSLPPAFFIIGAAALSGQSAGYYDQHFCVALITIASMAVSMAAVSWTAFTLRRIDLTRRAAELELRVVNTELVARGERLAVVQWELAHKARLSAMGEMAAALAHELNQPLTAVGTTVGAIELLLKDTSKPVTEVTRERVLRAVRQAETQAVRAGDIIRRLRRFVSRGEVDAKPEDLRALIEDAVALALPNAGSAGVTVRVSVEPDAEGVFADRVQVQQVIVNLVRNAVEAMRVQESAKIITIDATAEAGMATVRITDTGPGLAPDVAARLFSAFFTTKSEGMGVGLSICRHIIETHGGRMWCEPSDGGGADFRFTLPIGDRAAGYDGLATAARIA
jgi:signal transduction histidine kinase